MKQQKSIIEKVTKKIVEDITDVELYGWPPQCAAIYYQPMRPRKNIEVQMNDNTPSIHKNEM